MTATASTDRIQFPGISSTAFEHPLDRTALEALRKTPGLDLLIRKLGSYYIERQVRLHYTVRSLRLSPRQCPHIYRLMVEAAAVLDVSEPELYLLQTPAVNAMAVGMERHTVIVTSGLVDLLSEDELRGVIGHELGHIKSGHMLYRTMAVFLSLVGLVAARNVPFLNLITEALLLAFFDWSRKSELTADRAELLVTQDVQVCTRTLLKLAGGTHGSTDEASVEEFLKQADDFEDMGSNLLDALYIFEMTRDQTHPFPALRAREIYRWSHTHEYRDILRGEYAREESGAPGRRCARCGASVANPLFRFCPECGAEVPAL